MNNTLETKPTVKSFLIELSIETILNDEKAVECMQRILSHLNYPMLNLKIKSIMLVEKSYVK